jgi:hypothetical protein
MTHSAAQVVAQVLQNMGLGGSPTGGSLTTSWPVYYSNEPNEPDNCITVYDTIGTSSGRSMIDGELWYHYGVQIRIRATDHFTGWQKADSIRTAIAKQIFAMKLPIGVNNYLVPAVSRIGSVLAIGVDNPHTKRKVFTLNAVTAIQQLN